MDQDYTQAVIAYQRTGLGGEKLLNALSLFVYRYPRRYSWCTEDDCSDFFLVFFPRLRRIIKRYSYCGRPFETYLRSCLRWHLLSFSGRRRARLCRERVLGSPEAWGMVHENENEPVLGAEPPAYSRPVSYPVDARGRLVSVHGVRQVVLLLMKCVLDAGDQLIEHVAYVTGYDPHWLYHATERLRITMARRQARLEYLCRKRCACFFQILMLRDELNNCCEPERRADLRRRSETEHRRFRAIGREIASVPRSPTHEEIARILGIPKGSVDSGVHYARNTVARMS
jgi:hypothetical protein